ncbi:tyrosine-type recombinase/integrase [Ruminococcus sp.]|uniref:tyrosine-type recombinase/integrase n=1 Tax=Ruminococcus sp. TaxID=41978 RepID=UPI002FDA3674
MFEYKLHIDEFMNYCRYHKKLSDKTIRAYKIDLSQYGDFSNELSKQALWDYIEYLNKKYKPKTAKRKLATLKAFIHFLLLQDLIDFNPFDKLETTIKEPLLLPKTIPLGVIAKLISFSYQQIVFAKSDYQIRSAVRNTAILELLFATGARVAEICTLRSDNVDLLGNSVKFYGKGSKERIIPIENFAVLSILRKYHSLFEKEIPDSGYFFVNKLGRRMTEQSVRNMINFYCKQCGVDMHITPHMFRHSFATLLLEEDVDIRYIQRMLGHSSITTTQIYTHVTSAKQKEILKTKHPRNKLNIG